MEGGKHTCKSRIGSRNTGLSAKCSCGLTEFVRELSPYTQRAIHAGRKTAITREL